MLTQERLKQLLCYNQETGIFTWAALQSFRIKVGQEAGSIDKDGYRAVRLDYRLYRMHRLAWFYVTGAWPTNDIDHINGVRADNRWPNLRDVSRKTNLQNRRIAGPRNVSGYLGVTTGEHGFSATITKDGRQTYLGFFDSALEAHQAYLKAKRKMHAGCTI